MGHFEKMISSEIKFNGRIIQVSLDEVELENGKIATREVVRHPGGAAMVAFDDNENIILVKQFRYPFYKELLEVPAGKLEKGENPKLASIREMEEETGIIVGDVYNLGEFYPTCGFCDEIIYLYAGKILGETNQNLDEDEFVSRISMPLSDVLDMIDKNDIKDGKTIASCYKLRRLIDNGTIVV